MSNPGVGIGSATPATLGAVSAPLPTSRAEAVEQTVSMLRQLLAIYASGDRSAALAHVTTPALVAHGEADPLIQLPGGQATTAALSNAELLVVPGMGHGLPREIGPTLVAAISRFADRAKALHN